MSRIKESRVLVPLAVERHMGNPVIRELRETAAQNEDNLNIAVGLINTSPVTESSTNGSYTHRDEISQYEKGLLMDVRRSYSDTLKKSVRVLIKEVKKEDVFLKATPVRFNRAVAETQPPVLEPQTLAPRPERRNVRRTHRQPA